jgi:hypothetical protein
MRPRPAPTSPAVAAPPASPARLADELALVRRAWDALRAADHDDALRALEAHRARFPEGALAPERAAARALALCAAPGREDEARRVARAYIDAHGRSPLAARVRAACP